MGAWGNVLFQGDFDYDVIDELNDRWRPWCQSLPSQRR